MWITIVFLHVNTAGLVMATRLTYKAPRTKLQPTCLLTEHGIKPTTTGGDILNNYASKLAGNILYAMRGMTDMNELSHRRQILPYSLISSCASRYGSSDVQPSVRHLMYSFTQTVCTRARKHACAVLRGPALADARFTALDSQSSAKRTHTITTLPQFICQGSLTSFNCQA